MSKDRVNISCLCYDQQFTWSQTLRIKSKHYDCWTSRNSWLIHESRVTWRHGHYRKWVKWWRRDYRLHVVELVNRLVVLQQEISKNSTRYEDADTGMFFQVWIIIVSVRNCNAVKFYFKEIHGCISTIN